MGYWPRNETNQGTRERRTRALERALPDRVSIMGQKRGLTGQEEVSGSCNVDLLTFSPSPINDSKSIFVITVELS